MLVPLVVFRITPLCYWLCIKDCQNAAATGRKDTACAAGVNNIWEGECPQKEAQLSPLRHVSVSDVTQK